MFAYVSLAGYLPALWQPPAIHILIVTALAAPAMAYLVVPSLTRLLRR
jgi:antibiotic biosynthesis monooxygenase (ABM) superfamily enzyme